MLFYTNKTQAEKIFVRKIEELMSDYLFQDLRFGFESHQAVDA